MNRNMPRCGLLLCCAYAALLISCSDPPAPTQAEIEQTFQAEPIGQGQPAASSNADLDVYIDGSQSMQGFTKNSETNFTRKVRQILDQSNSGLKTEVVKFSTKMEPIPDYKIQQIISPEFYKGLDTPLRTVLDGIASKSNRMALVISDMVQSDVNSDEVALSRSLTALTQKQLQIDLLAFRSAFNGDYYIESLPKIHGKQQTLELHRSESLPDAGRPFYVLAVAPDRGALERLKRLALRKMEAAKNFSPADSPISVQDLTYSPAAGKPVNWVVQSRSEPPHREDRKSVV